MIDRAQLAWFPQSTPTTCGPACVVMALRHFGVEPAADAATERAIDDHCATASAGQPPPPEVSHISHPELARYWLGRGLRARQYRAGVSSDIAANPKFARYFAVEREALASGLELITTEPEPDRLAADLSEGWIAIVRVLLHGRGHHQLVYGATADSFAVACPSEGLLTVSAAALAESMTTKTGRSALLLRP